MLPFQSHLTESFQKVIGLGDKYEKVCFRNVSPSYANQEDVLSARGSLINGGRYNYWGAFEVLYLACELRVCIDEMTQKIEDAGLIANKLPRIIFGITVRLSNVLNLTNDSILAEIGITKSDLTGLNWKQIQSSKREALTQTIGRLAKEAGFEALLVPSARSPGRTNLCIFPDNAPADAYQMVNIDELPKTRTS